MSVADQRDSQEKQLQQKPQNSIQMKPSHQPTKHISKNKAYRQKYKQTQKRKGKRHRARPRTRDVNSYFFNSKYNDPLVGSNKQCELELQCKGY